MERVQGETATAVSVGLLDPNINEVRWTLPALSFFFLFPPSPFTLGDGGEGVGFI